MTPEQIEKIQKMLTNNLGNKITVELANGFLTILNEIMKDGDISRANPTDKTANTK